MYFTYILIDSQSILPIINLYLYSSGVFNSLDKLFVSTLYKTKPERQNSYSSPVLNYTKGELKTLRCKLYILNTMLYTMFLFVPIPYICKIVKDLHIPVNSKNQMVFKHGIPSTHEVPLFQNIIVVRFSRPLFKRVDGIYGFALFA